jgi:nucleotide-binding universal stress UspA family protein
MAIKDILVYVDNDKACGGRVTAAANLCQYYDAHLSGIYPLQQIATSVYAGEYVPASVFEYAQKETKEQCDAAKLLYENSTNLEDVRSEFRTIENNISGSINSDSCYADLLIVAQRRKDQSDLNPYYDLPGILCGAACPVLLLPIDTSIALPVQRLMLAWDGRHEGAMALRAALSMFQEIDKIDVVSVGLERVEAADIALHISRHGIETEVHNIQGSSFDAGHALLDHATILGSQLIVMGAYGHSRVRELVLGGATKHILEMADIPILFSH